MSRRMSQPRRWSSRPTSRTRSWSWHGDLEVPRRGEPRDAEREHGDALEQVQRGPARAPAGRPDAGVHGKQPRDEDQEPGAEVDPAPPALLESGPDSSQPGSQPSGLG